MKKFISILCIIMILFSVTMNVSADIVSDGEVGYNQIYQTIYIAGNLNNCNIKDGKYVTLALVSDNGDVGYIDQLKVEKDGSYKTKFKFDRYINDYTLRIKEGNNDVNDSVQVADVMTPTAFVVDYAVNSAECVQAVARIENKYGAGGTFRFITAFYDKTNMLLSAIHSTQKSYSIDDIKMELKSNIIKVPENCAYSKLFIWEDIDSIEPLAMADNPVSDESYDGSFGNDGDPITVAFIGDSITFQGRYGMVIEHYYHTRYPDRAINFVNKGISGNTAANVIKRFEWDITDDVYTGDIDAATFMIGMNDVDFSAYMSGNQTDKDAAVEKCISNVRTVIEKCIDKNIDLTLVTPSSYDESDEFNTTSQSYKGINSYGLKNIAEGIIKLADEYGLPVIDLWTPTTEATRELRDKGVTGQIITGNDRVHPEYNGAFVMAYEFIKQQSPSGLVAEVEIDIATNNCKTKNANLSDIDTTTDSVTYKYSPKSLPLAYTTAYKNAENTWGLNITDDINREIIKITGLDDGNYSINIGGNTLSKTYTAAQLADGINISIDSNNPSQKISVDSWKHAELKALHESSYRSIALTEQKLIDRKIFTASELAEEMTGDRWASVKAQVESVINEDPTFVYAKWNYRQYIGLDENGNVDDTPGYEYKPNQAANFADIQLRQQTAKSIAKPSAYTVMITKVNE